MQLLRWCGYCRLDGGKCGGGADNESLHRVYRAFTLALTIAYLLQECVYAYQERHDMDKVARVMFLLLCHITSIAKQLVFYLDADRVEHLVTGLDDPLYNQQAGGARRLLEATATWASRFVRMYSGCAVVTCTLWIIFPVIYHLRGQQVEFPFWIGVDYSNSHWFAAVLLYSYYVTTLVGIANTTMDAFMATVLNQCKTQLTILRLNFKSLPERAAAAAGAGAVCRARHDAALMTALLQCLAHYKHIVDTAGLLQRIFGTAILIQFAIGGWILCMAAYKIVSLSMLSIEFASMVLFTSCILTELFLYCYYGNEVTVESNRLVESIYSMEWVETGVRFKRALLIVMERAKRPLRPAAGLIIPLSLDTFVKIIKSSYTFYAVLRQTK
ncbi:odorant receptor 94a-like [Manduca sexta]|uniref:Odorant receptor n=1 Tax=Manduca sexta TaxID=7130 RepID=A0A5K8B136_MANSE|nr:odorant receptor 94a-like [Manduca sexta]CUQ99309.1 TPA: Olfactory receptor 76 [Manduca sexta]